MPLRVSSRSSEYHSNSRQISYPSFTSSDPPKATQIRLESLSHHNATIAWKKLTDPNQVQGFVLNYRQATNSDPEQQQLFNGSPDSWETVKLPKFYRRYTLTNLNCGTKYLAHLIGYNEIGESEPSNELSFSTKGNLPIAPSRLAFIQPNITSALLYLTAWRDGDCPMSYFQIQYKLKNEIQWKFHSTVQVTSGLPNGLPVFGSTQSHFRAEYHITSNELMPIKTTDYQSGQAPSVSMASTYGQLVISELQPGQWHDLQVDAFNAAGKTTANYVSATLTIDGETVPLILSDDQLNGINNGDFYLNFLSQYSSFTFIVVLFTLFVIVSVYVLYVRAKLQRQSTIDQCKHPFRKPFTY